MSGQEISITVDESILLKQFSPTDAPTIFSLINKNRNYLSEWLGWLDYVRIVDDSLGFIEQNNNNWANNKESLVLGIHYKGSIVGVIGFHASIDWSEKRASLGYWLDQDHNRLGIMTKAVKAIVSFGFEQGLAKITCACATLNHKSQAIPKRLGFEFEKLKKDAEWVNDHYEDHFVYVVTAEKWGK